MNLFIGNEDRDKGNRLAFLGKIIILNTAKSLTSSRKNQIQSRWKNWFKEFYIVDKNRTVVKVV